MVCFRYVIVNTLHKSGGGGGDDDDDDDDDDDEFALNWSSEKCGVK